MEINGNLSTSISTGVVVTLLIIAVMLADVDAIKHTIEINVCFSKIIGYHVLDFFCQNKNDPEKIQYRCR